jgi:hypothetical protein
MSGHFVAAHYERLRGAPSRRAHFAVEGAAVDILKWNPDANREGVTRYATVGLSDYAIDREHPRPRFEFFLGLLPELDEAARPLAIVASYQFEWDARSPQETPSRSRNRCGRRRRCERFSWAGTGPEVIQAVARPNDTHVEFLQLIPVFQEEIAFKQRAGTTGLIERWKSRGVEFWDPHRASPRL